MPSLPRPSRRNPRWEEDGPAARQMHRRQRLRELAALAASLVAVLGAGAAWAVRLGLAGLGRG
jgi:hypothetical protein